MCTGMMLLCDAIVYAAGSVFAGLDFLAATLLILLIFLSIFAFFLSVWLYRQNVHFKQVLESRQHLLKKCPYCGNFMQPDDSYCPNCGKRVPKVTTVK
ncbi:MAG TPA: zinc ribbon domain-containing protein [Ktedonobacteraceae bacterium]|nr:zinc ribbon domain-containing protein [Ktedonobacteraceae bacterium]